MAKARYETRGEAYKESIKRREFDTPRKSKFYNAYDTADTPKNVPGLAANSPAQRHTRQKSAILGRQSRIDKKTCKWPVSKANPDRDLLLEQQIEKYNIPVKRRQLTRKLNVTVGFTGEHSDITM
ncbi:hypothetical protein B0O99DRAFT_748290 [Bisporella sp. PMI_857]|nr:hypothetical protein B0O99DRAFT_748290 [Bisporella sp. PMI_857]